MTGHPFGVFVAFFGVFFWRVSSTFCFFLLSSFLGRRWISKIHFGFSQSWQPKKKPKRVSSTNSYSFSFGNNTRNTYNIQYIRRNVRVLEKIAVLKKMGPFFSDTHSRFILRNTYSQILKWAHNGIKDLHSCKGRRENYWGGKIPSKTIPPPPTHVAGLTSPALVYQFSVGSHPKSNN